MCSKQAITLIAIFIVVILSETAFSIEPISSLRYQGKTPETTHQIILVSVQVKESSDGVVSCYSRENAAAPWKLEIAPMPAKIGRNGLGEPGEKPEGNGKLPLGEWDLGYAFGFSPDPPDDLKIPYRQITDTDYWIDEPSAQEYNCWVSGVEPRVSHENMSAPVIRYNIGLVTLYNVHPINPGRGSAIFLHVWLTPNQPTAGCVALERENVVKILQWLDPKKRPRIRTQLEPNL